MISERHNYQVGDILLYNNIGDGFLRWAFGELIQYTTSSKYVHTALYLGDSEKFGPIVAESIASGFLVKTQGNFGHRQLRYQNGLSKKQKSQIIYNSLSMSGFSYGYVDLIKILIYEITGQSIYNSSTKKLTCAEAIARVYQKIGIKLVAKKDYDLVYPSDITESKELVEIS